MLDSDTKVWQNTLSNGVEYEIHQASGFSNHAEIAIKIAGECVTVVKVAQKRGGTIEALPMHNGKIKIKLAKPEAPVVKSDSTPVDLLEGIVISQTNNTKS
jgi:hypothetical protein